MRCTDGIDPTAGPTRLDAVIDTASGFGKAYLNPLLDEIRLDGDELHIQGSYRALARAVSLSKEGKLDTVPSFVPEWRARQDSNPRPLGS